MPNKSQVQVEERADRELFARIRQGNEQAFRTLFDRFYQFLLTVAYGILRDTESAKDVVQEVFFQIWQKRETIELRSCLPEKGHHQPQLESSQLPKAVRLR